VSKLISSSLLKSTVMGGGKIGLAFRFFESPDDVVAAIVVASVAAIVVVVDDVDICGNWSIVIDCLIGLGCS
jgi:hypothetical protein